MGAFFTRAGQIKYALPNDIYGLRIALSGGAFDAIIPFASTFVASSSGTRQTPYHVFINHHGQDVKHTLASKIYNSLIATGLLAFLDKDELKYGDLIPKALEKAMASASICISIFSEHYAESPWCLAELEYMVNNGKTIIPIFYHVDPADARWAIEGKRKYAAAFLDHEEKKRYAPEALQRWKAALQAASVCKGGTINSIGNIFCSHGKGNMKNRATRRSSHKERRLVHMKNRANRTINRRRAEALVPLPTPIVPTPHHHRVVASTPTHLSALSSNLVQQWTQAVHAPPLGHVCTSYGGICTGPQSNHDAAHDGHYAEGANFDDDVYAAHGDGSDEIDVSSFVDLMQQGEPGESQEQQRMDDTVPPRRQYTLFSRPTDIGIPYMGLSTCTQIDVSTGPIPVSTEAQPQIHAEPYHTHPYRPQYSLFSTPSYDYRASLPIDTSVTLATTHDYVTMSVAKSSGLSQMEVPTSSFEDLTTAAFGSFHSAPPPITEGHPSHVGDPSTS